MAERTAHSVAPRRPRLGVVKFASCDGCQLTLLDLEDELLAIAERFEIVEFAEATSRRSPGPYDILLVEGSISTPEQAREIVRLRRQSTLLVTIGAIGQLLELLTALTVGRRPQLPDESVCVECKRRGVVCVMVARGVPCLGPVTRTGCGALCPTYARGCYGCFGPREAANARSWAHWVGAEGRPDAEVGRLFAGFTAWSEPFRSMVTTLGGTPGAERRDARD